MRVEAFRGRVERRNARVERFNVSVGPIITVRGPNSEDDAEQIARTEFIGVCPSLSNITNRGPNITVRRLNITVRGPNSEDDAEQIAPTEFIGVRVYWCLSLISCP
jgi:hypothetical protein